MIFIQFLRIVIYIRLLTEALRVYPGVKPYKCDICNITCAQKDTLKVTFNMIFIQTSLKASRQLVSREGTHRSGATGELTETQ